MNNSVPISNGKLYALNLHTLAEQQNPLYGSGGGRWFFHDPTDLDGANKPLLDLSAVYQGSMRFLTGKFAYGAGTLTKAYISDSNIAYADWRPNPAGTFGIDHAAQWPQAVANDSDRESRLRAALSLPAPTTNIAIGSGHTCAVLNAGSRARRSRSGSFHAPASRNLAPRRRPARSPLARTTRAENRDARPLYGTPNARIRRPVVSSHGLTNGALVTSGAPPRTAPRSRRRPSRPRAV